MADKYHSDNELENHKVILDAHTRDASQIRRVGRWLGSSSSSKVIAGNQIYVCPFVITRPMSFDCLALRVNVLEAGKHARMGIYSDNGSVYPDTLLVDGGEVSLATASYVYAVIDISLPKGVYWTAVLSDATGTAQLIMIYQDFKEVLGNTYPGGSSLSWQAAQAYGALPATFPGSVADTNYIIGFVGLRVKSMD